MLSPDILLTDLLERFPPTASLFIDLRVDCLGCSMNKFCTLRDLSVQYQLDLEALISKIQERLDN